MKAALLILLVFEILYLGGIMFIATATNDYYGKWKQFWCDITIPFWRIIRESLNKNS